MLSCKDAAELLTSEEFERLPWHKKLALRMHAKMCSCPFCGAFDKQVRFFRTVARKLATRREQTLEEEGVCLPPETKERIRDSLKQ